METRRLEAFLRMVEFGSISRAAEHMGVGQPTLSQQLAELEHELQVRLLTRTPRGVQPTASGEVLYRYGYNLLSQVEDMKLELRQTQEATDGALTLGIPDSLSPALSVPLLQGVRDCALNIRLKIVEGSYTRLTEMMVNRRLDLVLSSGAPIKGFKSQLLFEEELVLVMTRERGEGFPQGKIAIADLAGQPFVFPTKLGSDQPFISQIFSEHDVAPTLVGEIGSAWGLADVAREGLALVVLGRGAALRLAGDLHIRQFAEPSPTREIYLSEPFESPLRMLLTRFQSLLKDTVVGLVANGSWPGVVIHPGW